MTLSADPSVRRHLGKSWFQYIVRHTWEDTMASTASRGHYCHGDMAHIPHVRPHDGSTSCYATGAQLGGHFFAGSTPRATPPWAPMPRGYQRHRGSVPQTTATGAQRHEGTNATGYRAKGYCHGSTTSPGRTFLRRNTWGTTTASTASDGHTYNPVLTGIHRAPIADSALQF
jgi:hypothetical protein